MDGQSDTRQFLPTTLNNMQCSAIQAVTASSAAAVIDTVITNPKHFKGPVLQEDFDLAEILASQHAKYLTS